MVADPRADQQEAVQRHGRRYVYMYVNMSCVCMCVCVCVCVCGWVGGRWFVCVTGLGSLLFSLFLYAIC